MHRPTSKRGSREGGVGGEDTATRACAASRNISESNKQDAAEESEEKQVWEFARGWCE